MNYMQNIAQQGLQQKQQAAMPKGPGFNQQLYAPPQGGPMSFGPPQGQPMRGTPVQFGSSNGGYQYTPNPFSGAQPDAPTFPGPSVPDNRKHPHLQNPQMNGTLPAPGAQPNPPPTSIGTPPVGQQQAILAALRGRGQ